METLAIVGLIGMIGYLFYQENIPILSKRGRLCEYTATGNVFTSVPVVLARGNRFLEIHVYSDEADYPVIANQPLSGGYDYAYDNTSFELLCRDLIGAFPSKDPFILSIVPHTDKTIVWNRVAESLMISLGPYIRKIRNIEHCPMDRLNDTLILVSGGAVRGTNFESLMNLSWDTQSLRRLGFSQAVHPRDYEELVEFNRSNLSLVAPDAAFGVSETNPDTVRAYGCQWILEVSGPPGFVEKPDALKEKLVADI